MPPANAVPPHSPPRSAVAAPHYLGFPPCREPPPGTCTGEQCSKDTITVGKSTVSEQGDTDDKGTQAGPPQPGTPRHGSGHVPDTEDDDDDARTPGSAEFFLRDPPDSSDDNTPLVARAAPFTYEQQLQLRAQLFVRGDLMLGIPPAEQTMVHAFGEPAEGQKHVWLDEWRAAVDRWERQKSKVPGYDTPPSSSLIEQGDTGEKETLGLDVGSATIYPPKNTSKHTEMLEQKNDFSSSRIAGLLQSGKPRYGSESVLDTEDVARTPGSAEFFSRDPPKNSDDNTTFSHTTFAYEQTLQWRVQLHVSEDLMLVKPHVEHTFGEHAEGKKYAWQDEWRPSVDRWESQKSKVPSYDTPPRSSFIGSCAGEQGSKDTTVGKVAVSEQGDTGMKETQGLDVESATGLLLSGKLRHGSVPVPDTEDDARTPGSAEFFLREPPECLDDKTPSAHIIFTSEQTNPTRAQVHGSGDLMLGKTPVEHTMVHAFGEPSSSLMGSCTGEEGSKDTTAVGKSTTAEQGLDVGSVGIHPPNNTTKHTEMLEKKNGFSSGIGSCIAEPCTDVSKTFISEQHSSDGGEEASQCPDFGSDHVAERNIDKVDHVITDDVNNLEKHPVCGGKQSLLDSCFKCGKHGQLVKCHSCPIAAHLSCFGPFGSSAKVSDGKFYCPFCIYLEATEAQKKADKKLSEARKDLSDFLVKPFAKQQSEQSTGNQQPTNTFHECNCHDPRMPARTRRRLAPRSRSFVSTARRTRITWTGEEEAALREAVARFALGERGQISWIRVWEHGKDIFHPTRLPKNLSQKWYNMKRSRSEASEGSGTFKV